MISQKDSMLPKEIQDFGCYFLCLVYCVGIALGKTFTVKEVIDIFTSAKIKMTDRRIPVIGTDCYVNDTEALTELIGKRLKFVGKFELPCPSVPKEEFTIQKWRNDKTGYEHFVVGDNSFGSPIGGPGNAEADRNTVLYDPLGQSNTVKNGYAKRLTILKKV